MGDGPILFVIHTVTTDKNAKLNNVNKTHAKKTFRVNWPLGQKASTCQEIYVYFCLRKK